jgi:hypothetical protein
MPAFVPSASVMLKAAADDLELDVLPMLIGFAHFRTRVIVNILRLLTRELELGQGLDHEELARLRTLLREDSGSLADLRVELVHRIEQGTISLTDPALLKHLRESLRGALAIDHPGWTSEED